MKHKIHQHQTQNLRRISPFGIAPLKRHTWLGHAGIVDHSFKGTIDFYMILSNSLSPNNGTKYEFSGGKKGLFPMQRTLIFTRKQWKGRTTYLCASCACRKHCDQAWCVYEQQRQKPGCHVPKHLARLRSMLTDDGHGRSRDLMRGRVVHRPFRCNRKRGCLFRTRLRSLLWTEVLRLAESWSTTPFSFRPAKEICKLVFCVIVLILEIRKTKR